MTRRSIKTVPMKVKNIGFLIDRLGKDCEPLQYLRELTVNAIEAVQSLDEKQGEIIWDVDWREIDLGDNKVPKLCIIDNGVGMTGEEMVEYINQLSSSGHRQSLHGNFGIGAKIAAATKNHAGVVYLSWKAGIGAMIHLCRNPDTGEYGLIPFEHEGKYLSWIPIEDSIKPELIKEHGTMVVLLGDHLDQDTMKAPPGVPSPSCWIGRYLNSRFFAFPNGVVVKAREGWQQKSGNVLRNILGAQALLNNRKECSGIVDLGNALAHWWILKTTTGAGKRNSGGNYFPGGQVGALYQNELYEIDSGRSGAAKLQKFGVHTGCKRVVLYIEPKNKSDVTANTPRTQLLVDGKPLPWARWADAFRDSFPNELKELLERLSSNRKLNHLEAIREKIRQNAELYQLKKFQAKPDGTTSVDNTSSLVGDEAKEQSPIQRKPSAENGNGDSQSRPKIRNSLRAGGNLYSLFIKRDGDKAEQVKDVLEIDVRWISPEEFASEDRAAHYVPETRTLLINEDFRVFTGQIEYWINAYGAPSGSVSVIVDTVRLFYELILYETVLRAEQLRGDIEWTGEAFENLISDEALTAAILPLYHIKNSVQHILAIKLGPPRLERTIKRA